jgi:hypothetical protein
MPTWMSLTGGESNDGATLQRGDEALMEANAGQRMWGTRRLAQSLLLLALAGCTVSEPRVDLPEAAQLYLSPEWVAEERVAPGILYRAIQSAHEPWMTHILEVDTDRCEIGFQVLGLPPEAEARKTVMEFVRESGITGTLAAVNGDFFTPENLALGAEASGGVLRGRTTRPVFAWRPGTPPRLSPVSWKGDSLQVGDWWLVRGEPDGATEVVAGFPHLLSEGLWVGDLELEERPAFAGARHPRTALGWDPEEGRLWIVVADGRREGVAEGMTLPELADLLVALGATDALNLDGGGSSTMVLMDRVVSRPSDPTGPRPVVNALVVRVDPALCPR